jgi:hypothetical protein
MVRPTCFYCGAALPAELLEAVAASAGDAIRELDRQLPPEAAEPAPAERPRRLLIILDQRKGEARALERALGLSAFEAGQRLRRGGLQLHRIAGEAEARQEAERLAGHGLGALLVDEAALATEPVFVSGGTLEPGRLDARTAQGRMEWHQADLLLVVKGPIQREYQAASTDLRRLKSASPSPGYCFHLHRRSDPRPLELDPDAFEFHGERGRVASSLLRVAGWIEGFVPPAVTDDGFRLLPPALGAAETRDDMARALGRHPAQKAANVVLDNLRQFRFYSAWRAAVERQR